MDHQSLKDRALVAAQQRFGRAWQVEQWSVAPGRIELIGNHTDYNGGPVLAAAIDRVLVTGMGAIPDRTAIELVTTDVRNQSHPINSVLLGDWRATDSDNGPDVYVKGVVAALLARDIPIRTGVALAVAGDIPPGFGMSSSAAFCLAVILSLTMDTLAHEEMIAIAREAEHRSGAMVGAMDQSASLAGYVIRFDGRDNSYQSMQPDLKDYVFAVADSGIQRSLRTSAYGTRVKETELARTAIERAYGLTLPHLAAVAPHWDEIEPTLSTQLTPELFRRVRHIVSETRRVEAAEKAMRKGDWQSFGTLMTESGQSSAQDYEISHPVVEELVQHVLQQDGVLGARMMGGGNGGPALVLLHQDAVDTVRASLAGFYRRHPIADISKAFYTCSFAPGAHREAILP